MTHGGAAGRGSRAHWGIDRKMNSFRTRLLLVILVHLSCFVSFSAPGSPPPPAVPTKQKTGGKSRASKGSNSGISLDPPVGTRDFYPEDLRLRSWLFHNFRETAVSFGFQEYDAPVLENEALYTRKAGEEITSQMYNFVDKGGYNVTLRPEMTPSLARMVVSRGKELLLPLKWFSIPQCWRFENMQRGRKREHYQWNMDIVGVRSVAAEAELLKALVTMFERLGLCSDHVGIKVNSRRVLASVLSAFRVAPTSLAAACVALDKIGKSSPEEVEASLRDLIGLPGNVAKSLVLAASSRSLKELEHVVLGACGEDSMGKDWEGEWQAAVDEIRMLIKLCSAYGIDSWVEFDPSVVRGLAYYTGVVFEAFDRAGELRAICGGGRYDRLMSLYGSREEVPCVGFGFGDCVIMELLSEKGLLPSLPHAVDFVVAAYSKDMMEQALQVAESIRRAGASADVMLEPKRKVWQAFDYGDRAGAKYLAFVAPDEWHKGMVRIKNLRGSNIDGSEEQGVEEGGGQGDGGGKQVDVPWEGFQDTVSAMMCK